MSSARNLRSSRSKNIFAGIDCVTVSGPSTGSPCVFPFTYKGKTYSRCTLDGTPEDDKVAWCSTNVDSQGNHVAGKKFWGRCNQQCGQPAGNSK